MAELLSDPDILSRLGATDWQRDGEHIVRDWKFKDFVEAITFVNRVADAAEGANHHPDILVHDRNWVRLSLTTHDAGGLTEADFKLAAQVDKL